MKTPASSHFSEASRSRMSVVYRRIEELKPNPTNPRRHTRSQIRQIGKSLKTFGFIVPVSSWTRRKCPVAMKEPPKGIDALPRWGEVIEVLRQAERAAGLVGCV